MLPFGPQSAFSVILQDVWFLIAGSGDDNTMARVKAMAALPQCAGRVIVIGAVAPVEMRQFYSAIDVLIDMSLHQTGSNGVLVEAMLSGVLLLVQDVGSVSMTNVPSEEYGLVFQPGNVHQLIQHVSSILNGEVNIPMITSVARQHALYGFRLDDMIDRYEALMYAAISTPARGLRAAGGLISN
jgi:glycosyltransferase involved in cell wall biosynthesis